MDAMTKTRQRWGQNVALGRHALKYSQEKLARLCGVTQQTISDIEAGKQAPGDWLKAHLAGALHQPVAQLFPLEPITPSDEAAA